MNRWGIVCPGLSLASYKTSKEVILSGLDTLVAVNGAILSWFNFRYWVIQDIEVLEAVWEKWQGINYTSAILFFPERWLEDIPRDWPKLNKFFNSFSLQPFISDPNEAFSLTMPFNKEFNWREYTKFMAIALAIRGKAQEIFLYADDMSGVGYYTPGLENCRTQHTERRWSDEFEKTKQVFQACEANGICITPILTPLPDNKEVS